MFRHRLSLRRWAACVLLLWLLGVGFGVAHACMAPAGGAPDAGLIASQAQDCGHGEVAPGADGDAGVSHVDQLNCQNLCDKAQVSISQLKSALDGPHGAALPPPAVLTTVPMPTTQPVQDLPPRRDGVAATPLRVAYLRLSL